MIVKLLQVFDRHSSPISIVAIMLSCISIICLLLRRKEDKSEERHFEFTAACIIMVVIVGVTGLCISVLLLGNADDKAVDQLVNMQGITLAITGAAVSLISIVATLQNYDHERRWRQAEERLNEELAKLTNNIDKLDVKIDLLQKGLFAQFMNELQQSYGSVAGRFFYEQFDNYRENVKAIEEYLPDLSKIEMNMNKIVDCYNQNKKDQIKTIYRNMYQLLVKKIEGNKHQDLLVQLYFKTRLADYMFYAMEKEESTIDEYYGLMENCNSNDLNGEELIVYYANCVIWLLTKNGKHTDERIRKCIDVFSDKNNWKNMIPTYYRNWGVYLERIGEIDDAKKKYEIAISMIDKEPNEYKAFVTYVASVTKSYVKSYKSYRKSNRSYEEWLNDKVSVEELRKCKAYLQYAKTKNPLFSDTYISDIYLNSYLFMLSFHRGDDDNTISIIRSNTENDYAMRTLFRSDSIRFEKAMTLFLSVCECISSGTPITLS